MKKVDSTEETLSDEVVDETAAATEETSEKTHSKKAKNDHKVASVKVGSVHDNAKHERALFTGSLGGHVLLDSTTTPDAGVLMGSVLGVPAQGVPGASQFAALQHKQVG